MEPNTPFNKHDTLRTSVLDAALQLGLANPSIAGLLFNPVAEEDEDGNPSFASSSDESAISPPFPITPPSNSTSSPTVHFRDAPRFYEDLRSSTSTTQQIDIPPPDTLSAPFKHKLRKPPPAKVNPSENEDQKRAMKLMEKQKEKEDKMREKEEKLREKEEKAKAKAKEKERGRDRAEKDKDGSKKNGFMGKFRMKSRERKGGREETVEERPPTPPLPAPLPELPIALRFAQGQRPSEDASLTRINTSSTSSTPSAPPPHIPTRSSPVHSPASSLSEQLERFAPAPALASIPDVPGPAALQSPAPTPPPRRPEWPKGLDMSAINQYYYGNPGGSTPTATRAVQPLTPRRPLSPAAMSPSQALSPTRSISPLPTSPRPSSPSPYIVPTPQPNQANFPPDAQANPKRPVIQFVAPPPSPRQLHLPPSPRPLSPNGAPPSPLQRSRPVSPISPHPPPSHPPPPVPMEELPNQQRFLSPSRAATLPPPSMSSPRTPSPVALPGQPTQRGRVAPFPTKPATGVRRYPSKRVQDPRLSRRLSFTDDQALGDGGRNMNPIARKKSMRKSVHLGGYDSDDAESRYSSYSVLSDLSRGPPEAEITLDLAKERERFLGHQRLLDKVRNRQLV